MPNMKGKVESMNAQANRETLATHQHLMADAWGLEPETTGGGCVALTRWFDGAGVWLTDAGGLQMPDGGAWIAGVIANDGEQVFNSRGRGLIGLMDALRDAVAYARNYSETDGEAA